MITQCPRCDSPRLLRHVAADEAGGDVYMYRCPDCGIEFSLEDESRIDELRQAVQDFLEEFEKPR